MIIIVILFFIHPGIGFSQCIKHVTLTQPVITEGITNGIDNYYQNLIIQDLALSGHQSFNEISIRFDYDIHYVTEQCKPGQLEIKLFPLIVNCYPLFYQGIDISASVKPDKADLVFQLIHHEGFVYDSLIFFDVALDRDSNFYSSLTALHNDTASDVSVSFSRAAFHYTRSSYEVFRDRILEIDQYYAASLLADSAIVWAGTGFLSETGNRAEMILRQIELQRIIDYISPALIDTALFAGQPDLSGLYARYGELLRLNSRFRAIILYNRFEAASLGGNIAEKVLLQNYLGRFDHYHEIAFQSDFRFVNFIEGLAVPGFNNAGLLKLQNLLNQYWKMPPHIERQWCSLLADGFIKRGNNYEASGNQLRALTYYQAAYKLSSLMNLQQENISSGLVCLMTGSISSSYLEISRKSALTENPAMAAQYFENAQKLYNEIDLTCPEPSSIRDYEIWLFNNFENQAVKYIELKNYNKALIYLNEIQVHGMSSDTYHLPGQFPDLMRTVREGIYQNLLGKAQYLYDKDELAEAEQVYRQAVAMRLMEGYRIDKDVMESKLEVRFRQIQYDDLIEEGMKYYKQEEFTSALYYFNKADFLGRLSLVKSNPDLGMFRGETVRQIVLQTLATGRVKAWGNDFDGATAILKQVNGMLWKYDIATGDSLTTQYLVLEERVRRSECDKVTGEFNQLMLRADTAKAVNDFIRAYKFSVDAVNLSLAHLNCAIRDDEAWYQKVLLEPAVDYQEMETELNSMTDKPCSEYIQAFQDLKKYYNRNKLLEQGIVFIPLFERIIEIKDTAFVSGMLDYYITLRDYDHAMKLLERLRVLGYPSRNLAYEFKTVAEYLARRDTQDPVIVKPWDTLRSYTGQDKWYRSFKWEYKLMWFRENNWKIKYWPFIWKK
jgi:tetratricopeptide (TPR) repeat protein